jgi:hypothetical protein
MVRECSTNGEKRKECIILVVKIEGKRPRRRWVDSIKMDLRKK